jgi:hypothetical protein
MPDSVVCNVCRKPIADPAEARSRFYLVGLDRRVIEQRKHDACNTEYMKGKVGLIEIVGQVPTKNEIEKVQGQLEKARAEQAER